MATLIVDGGITTPGLDSSNSNTFHTKDLYASTYVTGSIVSVINNQFDKVYQHIDKSGFSGPHGTLYFETLIPQSDNFVGKWIQKATNDLEISTQISAVENLMNDPKNLRETFFTSKKIMTETLKVNSKRWNQASERLTEAFSE